MSSVTEVAVPTSDFDGNAPVNGSDASMTVREVMAVAYLIGRHDALRVFNRGYEAGAGMVSDEIDALMRDVEALSGDDAVSSMLRHPSVSGGDGWWNR